MANMATAGMMSGFGSAQGAAQFLQTSLKVNLLSNIQTGDPVWDTCVAFVILSLQEPIIAYLTLLKNFILTQLRYVFDRSYSYAEKKYYGEKIKKTATIKYITDGKEINNLYEKVFWYGNTLISVKKEEEIQFQMTKNEDTINTVIPKAKSAVIPYKGIDITFVVASEVLTIHAEREHKRENQIITLSAIVTEENISILDQFIEECKTEYEKKETKRGWKPESFRNEGGKWVSVKLNVKRLRSIETVILKRGQLESVEQDLEEFIKSEEWYTKKSIPYTRGYLLDGPPGTGKSSLVRAMIGKTKRSIYYLILSNIKSDDELFNLMKEVKYETSILVIEDVDCINDVVLKRKAEVEEEKGKAPLLPVAEGSQQGQAQPAKENNTLTLSSILNVIDGGMVDAHGRILVMTTNFPEKLDPALIRSGRVDKRVRMGLCDEYQIIHLFKNYFDHLPPDESFELKCELSPADVASVFLQNKNDSVAAWATIKAICAGKQKLE